MVYFPPANTLVPQDFPGCPSGTPPLLALGGPLTFLCYGKDDSTGDFVLRYVMNSGGVFNAVYQYNWRSCMVGNSVNFFTDACDFLAGIDFFKHIGRTSEINLRARVSATGNTASNAGYVSLVFRLKNKLLLGQEIELHFMPYWYAQSGCYALGTHDIYGRHIFFFTPACAGSTNLGSGQSRFYNINLRSFILQRFADYFYGLHPDIDPVVSNWAVTWGLGSITLKNSINSLNATVKDVALDVLF
jgi:hypothetical protein